MQDHDEKSVLRYRSILMNEGWETVTNLNYRLEGLRGTPGIPSPCSFALEQFSSFLSWRLRYKGRRAFAASRLNAGLGVTLGIQDDLYHCGYHALEPKLDFLPTLLRYQYLSQVIASQSYQESELWYRQ